MPAKALVALLATILLGVQPLAAATITVNTFDQVHAGLCTIADAINSANSNTDTGGCTHTGTYGADTIVLPTGTYSLTAIDHGSDGLPVITSDITINGNGSTITRTLGSSAPFFRIIEVTAGSVTLNALTISGGFLQSASGSAEGGGIAFAGTGSLTLSNVTVTNNTVNVDGTGGGGGGTADGGGILFTGAGSLSLSQSQVTFNLVSANGGASGGNGGEAEGAGIFFDTGTTLSIDTSSVLNNTARADGGGAGGNGGITDGGGIFQNKGALTVTHSTIGGNLASANGGAGGGNGGISEGGGLEFGAGGTVNITDSAIVGNTSSATGGTPNGDGGIAEGGGFEAFGAVTITNSTIGNNIADASGPSGGSGGIAEGAGIDYSGGGQLTLINDTISGNSSVAGPAGPNAGFAEAGGIFVGDTTQIENTILAGNAADTGPDCNGDVTSLGNNLVGNTSGCNGFTASDKQNVAAGLGALTDNGQPGNAHFPLLSTSAAVNAGNAGACPATDQIGDQRSGICDIGSIEFVSEPTAIPTLDEWARIAMAALLVLGGMAAIRRMRAA